MLEKNAPFRVRNRKSISAIILTGLEKGESLDIDYSSFKGIIYQSYEDTAKRFVYWDSLPVHQFYKKSLLTFKMIDYLMMLKECWLNRNLEACRFLKRVRFVGFVTRRCFLEKPRRKVIMVDHNELDQVLKVEGAEIIEIIDHHRLDAEKTTHPSLSPNS